MMFICLFIISPAPRPFICVLFIIVYVVRNAARREFLGGGKITMINTKKIKNKITVELNNDRKFSTVFYSPHRQISQTVPCNISGLF